MTKEIVNKFKCIRILQEQDPKLARLLQSANEIADAKKSSIAKKDGILYRKQGREVKRWKTYIPKEMERDLILSFHTGLAHMGIDKTTLMLQEHLYFPKMREKVRKIVSCCDTCQRAKHNNVAYEYATSSVLREYPRELVSIDLHGPVVKSQYGYQYLLVCFDVYSKYVRIYPLKQATSRACLNRILKSYLSEEGNVKAIITDNGTAFTSKTFRKGIQDQGIQQYFSSKYHPNSNPVEREIKEVTTLMRILCSKKQNAWFPQIPRIQDLLNQTISPTTGFKPIELHQGRLINTTPSKIPEAIEDDNDIPLDIEDIYKIVRERLKKKLLRNVRNVMRHGMEQGGNQ